MREYKFRGKRIDTSEWVYGDLVHKACFELDKDICCICNPSGDYEVYADTVGQYTGLKDKNGVEIYEGDIIKDCEGKKQVVVWKNNGFKLEYKFNRKYQGEEYTETVHLELHNTSSQRWGEEVIGNIFENKDLLEDVHE